MNLDNKVFSTLSFIILFVGGTLFYLFSNWLFLPVFGLIWLLFTFKTNFDVKKLKFAVATGAFIAIFDWFLENAGAYFGYWVSNNSLFFIMAVPFEITLGFFFAGMAWYFLYNSLNWNHKLFLASAVLWSIGGMVGEYYLNLVGLMKYGNGWVSFPDAFVTYFVSFLIFYAFAYLITKKKK